MLHGITDYFSNLLFMMTGGVPLIDTFWILPYVIVMSAACLALLLGAVLQKNFLRYVLQIALGVILFSFTITIPMNQVMQVSECRIVTVKATYQGVQSDLSIKQCRHRNTIHDKFGEWSYVDLG